MTKNNYLDDFISSFPHTALTYDDVSLVTQFADFLPGETDISARLTSRIRVNIPFVSAAMDTVTEARMAIHMALLGGIGIIHKNLAPEDQARLVRSVKHHLNGLIANPVTFRTTDTLMQVRAIRAEKGYGFSGFPILDPEGCLAGILTETDLKFARNDSDLIRDVMNPHVITAEEGTSLEQAYQLMLKNRIGKLPLVKDGKLIGLYSFTDVRTLIKHDKPMYNRDEKHRLRVGAAVGPNDQARIERLAEQEVDVLVVDTAHGHSKGVVDMTAWIKRTYPHIDVIAGNIATGEAALDLMRAGADAVKVGIGPGSICTTRVVAGVGIPQIAAIYDCARALGQRIPIIADGGIRHSGDVPKALVAGADTVMMGSILAGTEESPGEKVLFKGRQYVVYRGMGSLDAMKTRAGSRERYGLSDVAEEDLVPQGIEGMVPYAGALSKVLTQYTGGLQASMGYCGCRTIPELQERGRFVRITSAGVSEAHPHDIMITKEAPNYRS
ncbi:MAG: IMP dehydrogenase [Kiritimatiellae bacterium]|nr:IMP dehydrogenase [Kiritimatiellia bacterium]